MSNRPTKIGKYDIISELGRGATAVVYLGEDQFNERKVAIKVALQDDNMAPEEARRFGKLFLNEAAMVGKLSHPNIVGVFDAVVEGDMHYIVMEYVGGGNLKKFCTETNLLPVRQAVLIIFKACRALEYAFQNGVIHRDIKSANILLSDRDEIKISDFGTAQISQATHTQIDGFVGSPAYMAPEQINEEPPSVQTDIYSLGVTMYELLAGRLPFQAANSVAMINKILNDNPTPLKSIRPDVPDKLVAIVEKAMAKDALETIKEMGDAAGFKIQYSSSTPAPPGFCIHEVGTARMGSDKKKSVLNSWNQTWDAKNVFVTDGACYASIGCQNPTLTMMAITARACDHIVDEMKRGNL
jgi:serine/threonine protein kinase